MKHAHRHAIKLLEDGVISGYGVVWGDPANRDLTGEYFTPETDLALGWYEERPLLYHHGLDQEAQISVVGRVFKMVPDEIGLWVEAQLDRRSEWATIIKTMVKKGLLNFSSGSVEHLRKRDDDGRLTQWPIIEMTVTPAPAEPRFTDVAFAKAAYKSIGLQFELPKGEAQGNSKSTGAQKAGSHIPGGNEMTVEITQETLDASVSTAVKSALEAQAAVIQEGLDREAAIEAEVQKRLDEAKKKKDPVKGLPGDPEEVEPVITEVTDLRYDHLSAADLSVMAMILNADGQQISEPGFKALAGKTGLAAEGKPHALPYDDREAYQLAAIKAIGEIRSEGLPVKANEIHYPTLASYGDEWVAVAYGSNLWEKIRIGTFVMNKLPTIEVPAGHESIFIPIESGDPTWYKVAGATDVATVDHGPSATITSSQIGTGRVELTLAKIGARTLWTGEMSEDSIIPFVAQLRKQFEVSGSEILEALMINGDIGVTANENINASDTTPAATDYFLCFNGFRVSPLLTTTANSRDAGILTVSDFIETVKLMGDAGKNALDRSKVSFIVDPLTHYKSLELPEVKTKDVASSPTIEGGRLTGLFGYGIDISGQIAYKAGNCLSTATGYVDADTAANNLYGQILAVRWDQWTVGFRRRMTMETTRIPRADTTELVAMIRLGLVQRDTEASAISYNVTV